MARLSFEKEFKNRTELDDYIRTRFGTDQQKNKEHTLELTADEMTALSLSETDTVFGIVISKRAAKEEKKKP